MKSNPRCLLILTVLVFLQAVFFETYAQTGTRTPVNISIAGVEYDDASFIKLKEAIKNNKKVQDLKQTFSDNTARISLSYTGDATELWDEIPVALKQAFKVTSIETNGFDLQLKNTAVANTPDASSANTNPGPVTKAGNDDCKN
jgi:outer membrane usher protein FimD/PapC